MLDPAALTRQIRETIATTLSLDESHVPDSINQAECAQWTSLNHMLLMVALEEQFGVVLSMNEMFSMVSLESIVSVLRSRNSDLVAAQGSHSD
jgi:acyl carrier protein